jgi:ubiquinone/menaquinone biosynthesis C-methylase UbiE
MSRQPDGEYIEETARYYEMRAREYEDLYYRPESDRREELGLLARFLEESMRGRRVLEVAAGTGYWTQVIAKTAVSVTGVDSSSAMLEEAKKKHLPTDKVHFVLGDAYALDRVQGDFDAAMVNFWISHVPRGRIADFFDALHARVGPGARVVVMDNVNVPGQGGEFVEVNGVDDTFKLRELRDGSKHKVIKNYLERPALEALFARHDEFEYHSGRYYYWLRYRAAA